MFENVTVIIMNSERACAERPFWVSTLSGIARQDEANKFNLEIYSHPCGMWWSSIWHIRISKFTFLFMCAWHHCVFMRQLFFHHLISFYVSWWVKKPICESLRLIHIMYKQDLERGRELYAKHRAQRRGDVFWCLLVTGIHLYQSRCTLSRHVRCAQSINRKKTAYTVRYTLGRPHTIHCTPSTFDMRRTFFELQSRRVFCIFNPSPG